MDLSKLNRIEFDDLKPGNKYYIESINMNENHPGTGQQYGIFDTFGMYDDEKVYAIFHRTYNFKDPNTNEYLNSCIGIGPYEAYRNKKNFIFYEPRMVTYNRKQNQYMGKVIENITNDKYMAEYITNQGWLDIE